MTASAFDRTSAATAIHYNASLPRNLMAGVDAMRAASLNDVSTSLSAANAGVVGWSYLPRWPLETVDAWRSRIASTFLSPYYARAWQTVVGKAFAENVTLGEDVPPEIVSLWENIDNAGAHGDVFAQWVFGDSLHAGLGHILVDYPVADGVQTLADERAAGLRPYWVYVPGDAVLGWRYTVENGRQRLTQFRYLECSVEPDGEFGEKEVKRARVYYASDAENPFARFEVYRQGGEQGKDEIERAGSLYPQTEIPLSTFYARRTGWMTARPFLQELAWVNLESWQSGSDQRNVLHFARVPFYFFRGFTESEVNAFRGVGSAARAYSENAGAGIEVIEGQGNAIGQGWTDIERIGNEAKALSMEPMVSGFAAESATGRAIDEARAHSALEAAIRNFEDCIEQALGFTAVWMGGDMAGGGSISLTSDLSVDMPKTTEASEVRAAVKEGFISHRTGLERWLDLMDIEAVDVDAELDAVESEKAKSIETFGRAFEVGGADGNPEPPANDQPQPPAEESA